MPKRPTAAAPLSICPPESFLAGKPDRRQDVYALACLTYEMLSGQPPYDALIARNRPRDIYPEAPESLPEQLWPLLKQALAYDREERPGSAVALINSFKQQERSPRQLKDNQQMKKSAAEQAGENSIDLTPAWCLSAFLGGSS